MLQVKPWCECLWVSWPHPVLDTLGVQSNKHWSPDTNKNRSHLISEGLFHESGAAMVNVMSWFIRTDLTHIYVSKQGNAFWISGISWVKNAPGTFVWKLFWQAKNMQALFWRTSLEFGFQAWSFRLRRVSSKTVWFQNFLEHVSLVKIVSF